MARLALIAALAGSVSCTFVGGKQWCHPMTFGRATSGW
jgi:hypothetical protein